MDIVRGVKGSGTETGCRANGLSLTRSNGEDLPDCYDPVVESKQIGVKGRKLSVVVGRVEGSPLVVKPWLNGARWIHWMMAPTLASPKESCRLVAPGSRLFLHSRWSLEGSLGRTRPPYTKRAT